MHVSVEPDGLAADGVRLAAAQRSCAPLACVPPGADPVSASLAARLSAHSASLSALIEHSGLLRLAGGDVTQGTAAAFVAADEANAFPFTGAKVDGVAVAVPYGARITAPAAPVLPGIPEMTDAPTMFGESFARALHSGPGAASLRTLGTAWRATGCTLAGMALEVEHCAKSIDTHWDDGVQRAGANTAEHAQWLRQVSTHATGLADAADAAADQFDHAAAMTPTPEDFSRARRNYIHAWRDNVRAHGLLSGQVSAAAAQMAEKQSRATEAGNGYYAAAATTTAQIPTPPGPAPAIVRPGGDGGVAMPITRAAARIDAKPMDRDGGRHAFDPATGGDTPEPADGTGMQVTDSSPPINPAGAPLDAGAAGVAANIAGTIVGAGMGTASRLLPSVMPSGTGGLASAPLSALSGLSGIPGLGSPGMPSGGTPSPDTGPSAGEPEPDAGKHEGLDTTSPAGGSGLDGGVGDPGTALPPVGAPMPASNPGPAAGTPTVSTPVAVPSGPSGVGGMGMYPPMLGGRSGEEQARRKYLFPDKRVVFRPVPNTEAVFGELEPPRRSRPKRATQEEGGGGRQE
jgi:hypothetical protein